MGETKNHKIKAIKTAQTSSRANKKTLVTKKALGLASFVPWLHFNRSGDTTEEKHATITSGQWHALDKARQRREPLIVHTSLEKRGQGHQSLILQLNREREQLWVDMPYPDLPASFETLSDRVYMSIRRPGAYHHWHLEGFIRERAIATDGPYLKIDLQAVDFRQDRRLQQRITFGLERATLHCALPMEQPIFGELENLSIGGVCFHVQGNLQQHTGFYHNGHMPTQALPVDITLNKDDDLKLDLQLLAMQVIKKPYLHTRVRARFVRVSNEQQQVLAALVNKPALSA